MKIYEGKGNDNDKNLKAWLCGNLTEKLPIFQSETEIMTVVLSLGGYGKSGASLKFAVRKNYFTKNVSCEKIA